MKREHLDKVNMIKLTMSGNQVYLASIKNFLTKITPDKEIDARLNATLVRFASPSFDLTFEITKDEANTEEGRSIMDLSWRLKGCNNTDISLVLDWKEGGNSESVIRLIKSLNEGSSEPIRARMDARMSRGK